MEMKMEKKREPARAEKKRTARAGIAEYIYYAGETSKAEISKNLNLSMPTVLTNVSELMDMGLVTEVGEYESTGGRKAKSLGIQKTYGYSMGVDITANHISMVLVNMCGEIEKHVRSRMVFTPDMAYCGQLSREVERFLEEHGERSKVLGIGISLPGIVDHENRLLTQSHVLNLENYSLNMLEQMMPLPVYFENDANAAMMAENLGKESSAVYLSLKNTLGGAVCLNGSIFTGDHKRAGEFGHMTLVPEGAPCYCGKAGCADAYCAASVLTNNGEESLDSFMQRLDRKELGALEVWDKYLEGLAILVSNLRMVYDMDIILGGDVGGYLRGRMLPLYEKIPEYNRFDRDFSYLRNCRYQKEASAVGAAKYFLKASIQEL